MFRFTKRFIVVVLLIDKIILLFAHLTGGRPMKLIDTTRVYNGRLLYKDLFGDYYFAISSWDQNRIKIASDTLQSIQKVNES